MERSPSKDMWARVVAALGPGRSIPERVALFAAAAAVGPSFEPGLQPRRTVHQAIATGVISASTLTLVTATQSGVEAVGRQVLRRLPTGTDTERAGLGLLLSVGSNVVIAGAMEALSRAVPAKEDEPLRRGLLRVAAQRTSRIAAGGAVLTAGVGSLSLISQTHPRLRWVDDVPVALPAGIAASALEIHRVHREASEAGDATIAGVYTANSVLIAIGVGAGVLGLQAAERGVATGVSRVVSKVAPSYDVVSNPIGHLVSLALLGGALGAGYEYAVRRVEHGGAAIEPAYDEAPRSPQVSGGPGSVVPFETLSREGRRFTNMVLTRPEIAAVMGTEAVADPIRLFVGLDSAAEVEDRVDLVMDELIRTRAFDRRVLCLASPTGSGYINYVMAEALEYLTLGDCAMATMQYSTLPSSMSLTRTSLAIDQNRALMHAITGYLRGMPEGARPRFVLFGESLGALTLQDVWRHRTVGAIDHDFVHSSLFLGTPSATEFAKAWRLNPAKVDPAGAIVEVDNFGEYLAMSDERRAAIRHVLISHHDDPIPKFGTNLLLRRPRWLGPPETRPAGVPKSSKWRPGTTFVLTAIDMVNAMDVVPGTFGRRGHDYREDIARFVSAAYDLPATAEQLARIESALRERELQWAQRRVVSEQVARAREALMREMKAWGVSGGSEAMAQALVTQAMVTDAASAAVTG